LILDLISVFLEEEDVKGGTIFTPLCLGVDDVDKYLKKEAEELGST
jgi:hypothetical protein